MAQPRGPARRPGCTAARRPCDQRDPRRAPPPHRPDLPRRRARRALRGGHRLVPGGRDGGRPRAPAGSPDARRRRLLDLPARRQRLRGRPPAGRRLRPTAPRRPRRPGRCGAPDDDLIRLDPHRHLPLPGPVLGVGGVVPDSGVEPEAVAVLALLEGRFQLRLATAPTAAPAPAAPAPWPALRLAAVGGLLARGLRPLPLPLPRPPPPPRSPRRSPPRSRREGRPPRCRPRRRERARAGGGTRAARRSRSRAGGRSMRQCDPGAPRRGSG